MGLWRDKTRGDWCYSFEYQKEQYAGRGFKTKGEARSAREDRRKEVKKPKEPIPTGMDFESVANKYLDFSQKRHAKKTYEYKAMVYASFLKRGNPVISEITPGYIQEYLVTRPTKHNYNVHRKELSAVFQYAVDVEKIIAHNPLKDVQKLPEEKRRKKPPTKEEFTKIYLAANPEQKALILILAHTLARISEILKMPWSDVNFHGRYVTLWTRKRQDGNSEPRYIPMNNRLYNVLMGLWETRIQDEYVFWNLNRNNPDIEPGPYNRRPKMMHSICERAGITPISTTTRLVNRKGEKVRETQNVYYGFHAIRHFIATYMHDYLKIGTSPVGGILGHKSKRTTEEYLHPVDEGMRHAMAKLDDAFEDFLVAADGCGFCEKEPQKRGNRRPKPA